MGLQYVHLLIPERADFAPYAEQVPAFLENLANLASAPLDPTLKVARHSGRVRSGTSALTGEKLSVPIRDRETLKSTRELATLLLGLSDYDVTCSGKGPPPLTPFALYSAKTSKEEEFNEHYAYDIVCSLRASVVSTCDTPPFGTVCSPEVRTGVFRHPKRGTVIEVPNAACARFWLGFEFGKWIFPKIGDSLNVLEPAILNTAIETFGTKFAQGCILR